MIDPVEPIEPKPVIKEDSIVIEVGVEVEVDREREILEDVEKTKGLLTDRRIIQKEEESKAGKLSSKY